MSCLKINRNIIIKYALYFLAACLLILLILSVKGFDELKDYCDAFFIGGFTFFAVGGLSFVNKQGGYDMFSYSAYYIFKSIGSADKNRKYRDYKEYIDKKSSLRSQNKFSYLPFIFIGLILIIIAIILFFLI